MSGGVQELHFDNADLQGVPGVDADHVRLGNVSNLLHAVRFVPVRVDLHRRLLEQLRDAGDVVPAHAAADVIRVIVGRERRDELVVALLKMAQQPVDVPGGVHGRHLAGAP